MKTFTRVFSSVLVIIFVVSNLALFMLDVEVGPRYSGEYLASINNFEPLMSTVKLILLASLIVLVFMAVFTLSKKYSLSVLRNPSIMILLTAVNIFAVLPAASEYMMKNKLTEAVNEISRVDEKISAFSLWGISIGMSVDIEKDFPDCNKEGSCSINTHIDNYTNLVSAQSANKEKHYLKYLTYKGKELFSNKVTFSLDDNSRVNYIEFRKEFYDKKAALRYWAELSDDLENYFGVEAVKPPLGEGGCFGQCSNYVYVRKANTALSLTKRFNIKIWENWSETYIDLTISDAGDLSKNE